VSDLVEPAAISTPEVSANFTSVDPLDSPATATITAIIPSFREPARGAAGCSMAAGSTRSLTSAPYEPVSTTGS
jgi:hypothetical protein